MRLTEVTVGNYRSITQKTHFKVTTLTTLVGPNNEGKSNLLRALVLGMTVIRRWAQISPDITSAGRVEGPAARHMFRLPHSQRNRLPEYAYVWPEDYPLNKQDSSRALPTVIRLRFQLTTEEIAEFKLQTGITSNGDLPVEIKLDRRYISLGIVKPGQGATSHQKKANLITKFIADRIALVQVPAIRTGDQAVSLASELVLLRTRSMKFSEEFLDLTSRLDQLRREAVQTVATELSGALKKYIPSIDSLSLKMATLESSLTINDMIIHDGVETSIDKKGDGIKNLITMALIQELATERSAAQSVILAVDEPEAHLHPASVHGLQTLFTEISEDQQVILATHDPIFVNRDNVGSNILVRSNAAKPARSVKEIRQALGVHLGDNLESAEIVVLVEGLTDQKSIPFLLSQFDKKIMDDVKGGRIQFRSTHGTGKIRYQIQREKATICKIRVVMDDDQAGRDESKKIEDSRILASRDIFLVGGRRAPAELEDIVDPAVYLTGLQEKFGREFSDRHFANRSRKWSENFLSACRLLGVAGEEATLLEDAKLSVCDSIQQTRGSLVRAECTDHVKALATFIRS
ncbi:ATP-binding protein [Micrococcus sp. EYE_162]|uniref:ATP-dependent nuclease n=1 Tax=unclassified Micrococcus TaxID=2620948 RepID=UPI002005DF59|nr:MULTISPECIES: AAA family ATPase [unclassified Micrococcus]MCK6095905.1 ATP-binding protein [Micrococcus sp. EYE_212]MCK6171996.1 ATP-binding protein [Micrococcus sp. EYE_162]